MTKLFQCPPQTGGIESAKTVATGKIKNVISEIGTALKADGFQSDMVNSAVAATTSFYTSLISNMKDNYGEKDEGNWDATANTAVTRSDGSTIVITSDEKYRQDTYKSCVNLEIDPETLAFTDESGLSLGENYNKGNDGSDNTFEIAVNPQALLKNFQNFMSMYWV